MAKNILQYLSQRNFLALQYHWSNHFLFTNLSLAITAGWPYWREKSSGQWINQYNQQVETTREAFRDLLFLLFHTTELLVYFLVGLFLSWKVFSLFFVVIAFGYLFLHKRRKYTSLLGNKKFLTENAVSKELSQVVRKLFWIKSSGEEDWVHHRLQRLLTKQKKGTALFFQKASTLSLFYEPIGWICLFLIVLVIPYLSLSLPQVVLFLWISKKLLNLTQKVGGLWENTKSFWPSYQKLMQEKIKAESLIAQRKKQPNILSASCIKAGISSLSCTYKEKVIFENLSLSFPPQGLIMIYGENGAGKSSLLEVLSGLHYRQSDIPLVTQAPSHYGGKCKRKLALV